MAGSLLVAESVLTACSWGQGPGAGRSWMALQILMGFGGIRGKRCAAEGRVSTWLFSFPMSSVTGFQCRKGSSGLSILVLSSPRVSYHVTSFINACKFRMLSSWIPRYIAGLMLKYFNLISLSNILLAQWKVLTVSLSLRLLKWGCCHCAAVKAADEKRWYDSVLLKGIKPLHLLCLQAEPGEGCGWL